MWLLLGLVLGFIGGVCAASLIECPIGTAAGLVARLAVWLADKADRGKEEPGA